MRLMPLFLVTVAVFGVLVVGSLENRPGAQERLKELKEKYSRKATRGVDHAKLPALKREFASGREVTQTCISCHTERHTEVMKSAHWNWSRQEYVPGRGIRSVGKKNVINNFCIGVSDNQEGCSRCHVGYGMDGQQDFDFKDSSNVDCLICHDTTETYEKTLAGLPKKTVNLANVAQHVGRPQRANCGSCHFSGGGGNNVKHGDLEQALLTASRDVDIHMSTSGANLDCVACHETQNHKIKGKMYSVASMNHDRSSCEQCHGETPHKIGVINEHSAKVACQTCHIPAYAKVNETKLAWDWSTAGKLKDGEPFEVLDAAGNPTYASIKGNFTWARNVKPDYMFFNGKAGHYLLGDKVGKARPEQINSLQGSYDDPDAKIVPVKIHRGKQIYDPVNDILIQPKLYAREKGEGGFWKDFKWNTAAAAGMKASGLPYSGKYEFVETAMYWPVNHMVSPKEKALDCAACHTPNDSRLAGLGGFYMPGRDRNNTVEALGLVAIVAAIGGALFHGLLRFAAVRRRRSVAA